MGFLDALFGKKDSPKTNPPKKEPPKKAPQPPLILRDLNPTPNETRDNILRDHITRIGLDNFPDDEGVEWTVLQTAHLNHFCYAEVTSSEDTGYEKYTFLISFAENENEPDCPAIFCWEDGEFSLLATSPGFPADHPKVVQW